MYIFTMMPVNMCTRPSPQLKSIMGITSTIGSNRSGKMSVWKMSFQARPKNVPMNGPQMSAESPPKVMTRASFAMPPCGFMNFENRSPPMNSARPYPESESIMPKNRK